MEEEAIVSTGRKCQSEGNETQYCPLGSTYADGGMFISILTNDLLTLCSYT